MTDEQLARCPCGEIPEKLCIEGAGLGRKHAMASGYCCGDWSIEFRTSAQLHVSGEDMRLAREAWNAAPRGNGNELLADDLASLLRRVVHSLRKSAPNNDLADRALDYLKRHGQSGSVLRGTDDGVK